jgi:hypothetical protein
MRIRDRSRNVDKQAGQALCNGVMRIYLLSGGMAFDGELKEISSESHKINTGDTHN